MKLKNLLIFNQHASYITIDIANAFADANKYDNIVLLAGVVNVREDRLNKRIRVIKTISYNKNNIYTRFFSWSIAFIHLLFLLTFRFRSYKLFLVSNPPLISFLPYFCSNQYSALIFDIYPDALTSNGFVSKQSFIYRLWRRANLKFYKRAKRIITISEGMKGCLSQYCDTSRIEIVSLWSSFPSELVPKNENIFIKNFKLQGKFIIMYSGNMGKSTGLEPILDVANIMLKEKDMLFMFIGDGWLATFLQKQAKDRNLSNCIFLPYQDASILMHSLSAADIAIIASPSSTQPISIPNKTYTLVALGRPLLCITGPGSDLNHLVSKFEIGECFDGREVDKMVKFIYKTKNDSPFRLELSHKTQQCSINFTKENAKLMVL